MANFRIMNENRYRYTLFDTRRYIWKFTAKAKDNVML